MPKAHPGAVGNSAPPAAAAQHDPRSFDGLPRVFDRFAELVGGPLDDYLTERLPPHGGRAVDLGCGTGRHASLLARRFDEVLAVDVSAPMLHLAQRRRAAANIHYRRRDLLDVAPEKDGTFDFVLSTHTLHHLPHLTAALTQIRSLTRPGGQVVLVDNVDPRRQVPRRWFQTEARKALLLDLRRRRRPVREAVEVYRLSVHPAWLDHLASDLFPTAGEVEEAYGAAFPGAEFTPSYRTMAMHWRKPGR
jgi:SAM-dependent methyltransferase